jgi:predicted enzyme related to lactoylglutathione lyase
MAEHAPRDFHECTLAPRAAGIQDDAMKVIEFAFVAYPVTDIARSRKFYEEVLQLTPSKPVESDDVHWVEYEVGPHTLGIGCHPAFKPSSDGPSLALEVENFEESIEHLKKHGVSFHMGPMETPVCWMGMFKDPDGNVLTVHKRKA